MTFIWEDIGSRPYMEDTYSYDMKMPYGFEYYGVFDGHGGNEVSLYLQRHMRDVIKKHIIEALNSNNKNIDISNIIYNSFKTIVDSIPYKSSVTTGSTAIVMLRYKNKMWIGNVGDSRAIMNNGLNVIQLSQDHKPNEESEYKRITSLGGKVTKVQEGDAYRVNGVLAVSRAIGDFALSPYVTWKPTITTFDLGRHNHYVFLATDGVWDVLSSKQVIDIINNNIINETWKNIGNDIISIARSHGSGDNIACMFVIL
jgi:protein phosphatase 1L